jgi:predicted alpha/beta-hydrolase family hydrolase
MEIETPQGLARADVRVPDAARGALVLGHGAGGGIGAPDLAAAASAAEKAGFAVALVEQPYRVAGRKAPPRAPQLDEAWLAVVGALRAGPLEGLPLVTGGRSSGARVACRTAADAGAGAVLCLAFPLRPPRGGADRLAELDGVRVPVLVVQGERDPFGIPPPARRRRVVVVRGDHSLRAPGEVAAAVGPWLRARRATRAAPGAPRRRA